MGVYRTWAEGTAGPLCRTDAVKLPYRHGALLDKSPTHFLIPYFSHCIHTFPTLTGQLEVHLCPRGLYPYEPPLKLAYRLPDQLPPPPGSTGSGTFNPLGFPAAAALTAAAWRRSLALCGEPQVWWG